MTNTKQLREDVRKIADDMFPQVNKNEYSQYEVEKLLIAVGEHFEALLQAHEQEVREETLNYDNFANIVKHIGENWTYEQMINLLKEIEVAADGEFQAMEDSL